MKDSLAIPLRIFFFNMDLKVKYAITHPGIAHADDSIAAAMLSAFGVKVFRKVPSAEEINDPTVIVFDIGGEFDIARSNYDHHQAKELPCSLLLLLSDNGFFQRMLPFEYSEEDLKALFGQVDLVDRVGPEAAFRENNPWFTEGQRVKNPMNVFQSVVTGYVSKQKEIQPGDRLMMSFGWEIISLLKDQSRRRYELELAGEPDRKIELRNGLILWSLLGLNISPMALKTRCDPARTVFLTDSLRDPNQAMITVADSDHVKIPPMQGDDHLQVEQVFLHTNRFCAAYTCPQNSRFSQMVQYLNKHWE